MVDGFSQSGGDQAPSSAPRSVRLDDDAWFARLHEYSAGRPAGQIGHYELLGEAGRGGQGVVYKARQPRTGRTIAIKRLSAGVFATPQMRARFEREVEAAAALDHPGIVTVFGCDVVDQQTVLAMQWVDGLPIDTWAQGGPGATARRGVDEVLGVFRKVCAAVHHAHQRGVIHRDLKPSNILIDSADQPHVLDFGLAKLHGDGLSSSHLTLTGEFIGTPLYAAPEQVSGQNASVDVRTDVYALGAVLYRALTGRALFEQHADLGEMFRAVQQRDPLRPSAVDARVNRELDAIVLKAVAKEKDRRYASVEALAADVQRYLAGEAVLAHPPSRAYRVRKFVRAHGVLVWGAALFVALLLAAAIVSTTFYVQAERERQRAEAALLNESQQRTHAEEQERLARMQSSKQEAVNRFLNDMLRRADLTQEKGQNLTLREVLDAAAGQLAAGEQPMEAEVEAALNQTVGYTYENLGLYAQAEPHLQRATERYREAFGDVSEDVLNVSFHLARVLRVLGRVEEAEPIYALVLENRRALLGPRSPYVAQTLASLGILQRLQGKYAAAERSYREAVDIYRELFGDDENVCSVLISLAIVKHVQGFPQECEAFVREALAIRRTLSTADDPETGTVLISAGSIVADRGAALAWLTEGIEVYQRLGLSDHPQIGLALGAQAGWAVADGDYAAGEELARQALAMALPGDQVARTKLVLARALRGLGCAEEAFAAAEAAAEFYYRPAQFINIDSVKAFDWAGVTAAALGLHAEAEAYLLDAVEAADELIARGESRSALELRDECAANLAQVREALAASGGSASD